MPYTLLYSRSISSEAALRVLEVPITDRSVMIEVLSLVSPFRRLAGYAYALRSDGITDYERSSGVTLPFGKNRVNFTAATPPYFLEFFPRWGVRSGIISVYTGEPVTAPPPSGVWKAAGNNVAEFRLAQNPNRIEYRQPIGSTIIRVMASGAVDGAEFYGYVGWQKSDGSYWYARSDDLSNEYVDSQAGNQNLRAGLGAIIF